MLFAVPFVLLAATTVFAAPAQNVTTIGDRANATVAAAPKPKLTDEHKAQNDLISFLLDNSTVPIKLESKVLSGNSISPPEGIGSGYRSFQEDWSDCATRCSRKENDAVNFRQHDVTNIIGDLLSLTWVKDLAIQNVGSFIRLSCTGMCVTKLLG